MIGESYKRVFPPTPLINRNFFHINDFHLNRYDIMVMFISIKHHSAICVKRVVGNERSDVSRSRLG